MLQNLFKIEKFEKLKNETKFRYYQIDFNKKLSIVSEDNFIIVSFYNDKTVYSKKLDVQEFKKLTYATLQNWQKIL